MKSLNNTLNINNNLRIAKVIFVFCLFSSSLYSVEAQSISQNFPTPIVVNEIDGKIPARDIGDSRLTSHFYAFNATQGDVFINVVTSNLNGDIDVFTADNLRPLTKITLYADVSENETGRVIYLRQSTKLILRIEGRTPNDNPATYRIKFAGSFMPAELISKNADSEMPQVKSDNQSDIRVNSVGTIISVKPKPKEVVVVSPTIAETDVRTKKKTNVNENETDAPQRKNQITETVEMPVVEGKNDEAPINELSGETSKTLVIEEKSVKDEGAESKQLKDLIVRKEKSPKKVEPKEAKKSNIVKSVPVNALGNIRLIVLFKDGTKIERQMSDVLKVGVDKGILTVIAKDGQIGRYSILDVEKMTIE